MLIINDGLGSGTMPIGGTTLAGENGPVGGGQSPPTGSGYGTQPTGRTVSASGFGLSSPADIGGITNPDQPTLSGTRWLSAPSQPSDVAPGSVSLFPSALSSSDTQNTNPENIDWASILASIPVPTGGGGGTVVTASPPDTGASANGNASNLSAALAGLGGLGGTPAPAPQPAATVTQTPSNSTSAGTVVVVGGVLAALAFAAYHFGWFGLGK